MVDVVFAVSVAHASHRHRLAAVHGVAVARVDPVEVAEEERRRAAGARGRLDGTPLLRDTHQETEPVHQLRQLVMTALMLSRYALCAFVCASPGDSRLSKRPVFHIQQNDYERKKKQPVPVRTARTCEIAFVARA